MKKLVAKTLDWDLVIYFGISHLDLGYYIFNYLMDVIIDLQWGPKFILYSIFGGISGTYFTFMGRYLLFQLFYRSLKDFIIANCITLGFANLVRN